MKIPQSYSSLENRTLFVISNSELVPKRLVRDKVINEHASGQTGAVIRQTRQNKSPGGDGSYVWQSMRSARGDVHIPLTLTVATNCGTVFGSRKGRWQISFRQHSINSDLYTDYGDMLTIYRFTLPKPEYTPCLSFQLPIRHHCACH